MYDELKKQVKVTSSEERTVHGRLCVMQVHSVYLLYWYKSAYTDVHRGLCVMQDMTELKVWKASDEHIPPETLVREAHELAAPGTQFTCFTGTEVRILTHAELRARQAAGRAESVFVLLYQ